MYSGYTILRSAVVQRAILQQVAVLSGRKPVCPEEVSIVVDRMGDWNLASWFHPGRKPKSRRSLHHFDVGIESSNLSPSNRILYIWQHGQNGDWHGFWTID